MATRANRLSVATNDWQTKPRSAALRSVGQAHEIKNDTVVKIVSARGRKLGGIR